MTRNEDSQLSSKKHSKIWVIVLSILVIVFSLCWLVFFFLIRPRLNQPLNEPLDLNEIFHQIIPPKDSDSQNGLQGNRPKPVCGDVDELTILVIGTDYRNGDYYYGLADAIRIIGVDFTVPQVNVVALPRALLIEQPGPRLDAPAPILLNQAYFFGTQGMGHYSGTGYGAGALAETLQINFGVPIDNYLVVNFFAFQNFIDQIGGIQVDLPETVYISDSGDQYFSAGIHYLDGEDTLKLARARALSSDNTRIDNQTLILKGIIQRLKEPEVLLKLPQLIDILWNAVLTDTTPAQIQGGICLLDKLTSEQIHFFNPELSLLTDDRAYIPSMNKEMNIFRWDQDLVTWLLESLATGMEP